MNKNIKSVILSILVIITITLSLKINVVYAAESETACYQCKSDNRIKVFRNNDTADSTCSSGYEKLDSTSACLKTGEREMEEVVPEFETFCYQCKSDTSINMMSFGTRYSLLNEISGDSYCSSGYKKVDLSFCKIESNDNPETGSTAIWITWITACIAISCSLWYLKKSV